MADDIVIRAEELGKKYVIGHEAQRERYVSLRDVIARSARNAWRMATDMAKGRVVVPGDTVEEFWALKDVSFEVKRGEVLGIIGRNGAGKSTLLKILSRITEPSEGRVTIKGRVASLLEVGTGFHPELTGRENIYLNGAILGMTRAEIKRKFDEIVAFAEVEKFLDTPVKRYSSGMYVRLAFAVAAHLEPEILIVDEVLSVGDAEFQKKSLGKMQDVAGHGRTVLFVSHSMSAITRLCSRGVLLRSGKVAVDGDASEVVSAHLSDASHSSAGEFDLSSHPGRSRGSSPIIRRVRLCASNYVTSGQLYPDEECFAEIDYELPQQIPRLRWAIAIEDFFGRRLMTFASYFQRSSVEEVPRSGTIRCSMGPLCLGSGRYLLSVSVGSKEQNLIDSIDNAAWFEINWNNYYENSEPYSQVYGPLLRKSEWEFVNGS